MSGTMLIILGLAALGAALAYWAGFATRQDPGATGAALKTASTGGLALILWLLVGTGTPDIWPIALGLTLGALGDWCLAQRGTNAFLAGMAAFAAGHIAYVYGFLTKAAQIGFPPPDAIRLTLAALLIALVASTEAWLAPRTGTLRAPVRAYVLIIGAMGLSLLALPSTPASGFLWLGGGLFILSDLLLALRLFVVARPNRQAALSLALWPAYWSGQALIALSGTLLGAGGLG